MAKCPNCQKVIQKPHKSWVYGIFKVDSYSCDCGTNFREYTKSGKLIFTLRLQKGRWKKIKQST
jgi:hypothetical protein